MAQQAAQPLRLAQEVGQRKLEHKVGQAGRGELASREESRPGRTVLVFGGRVMRASGARSINIEELGEQGWDHEQGAVVGEERVQKVGPVGEKAEAVEPAILLKQDQSNSHLTMGFWVMRVKTRADIDQIKNSVGFLHDDPCSQLRSASMPGLGTHRAPEAASTRRTQCWSIPTSMRK